MPYNFLALIIIFIVANISETITGFGSTIIAVALGGNFYELKILIPVLVPLNLIISAYIVAGYHRQINKNLLFKKIFPLMITGLITGIIIFNLVPGTVLKKVFGILVFTLATIELINIFKKKENITSKQMPYFLSVIIIFFSGIIHGVYACGGPFLVYYTSKLNLNKQTFRSTLSLLWLILNFFLTLTYIKNNNINIQTIKLSLMLLPTIPLAIFIGELVHHKINEKHFKIFIYLLLLIAGISLIK